MIEANYDIQMNSIKLTVEMVKTPNGIVNYCLTLLKILAFLGHFQRRCITKLQMVPEDQFYFFLIRENIYKNHEYFILFFSMCIETYKNNRYVSPVKMSLRSVWYQQCKIRGIALSPLLIIKHFLITYCFGREFYRYQKKPRRLHC